MTFALIFLLERLAIISPKQNMLAPTSKGTGINSLTATIDPYDSLLSRADIDPEKALPAVPEGLPRVCDADVRALPYNPLSELTRSITGIEGN